MSDKKTFAVAMIGIPDHEQNVLKNIFKLSLYRTYTYTLISANEPGQIFIVDADNPDAVAEWRSLYGGTAYEPTISNPHAVHSNIPTVMVTKEKIQDQFPYHIYRPFVATRVLGILDQVAITIVSVPQNRVIGEESLSPAINDELPASTALVVPDSQLSDLNLR